MNSILGRLLNAFGWIWYAGAQLIGIVWLILGIFIIGAASACKAWTDPPDAKSLKPLPDRMVVDRWKWPINGIYGNPEDGVSGRQAYGPTWAGPFNASGSRWYAFEWSGLRNWANNWAYITWPFPWTPPLYASKSGAIKLGWKPWFGGRIKMLFGL